MSTIKFVTNIIYLEFFWAGGKMKLKFGFDNETNYFQPLLKKQATGPITRSRQTLSPTQVP